jgi:hypothetical protein
MYWFIAALLVLGAICGATVRLMVFVVVLVGAAAIAAASGAAHGGWTVVVDAVVAIACLQVGYVAGLVLRAKRPSPRKELAAGAAEDASMRAGIGGKPQ